MDGDQRAGEVQALLERKPGLRLFYQTAYRHYAEALSRCPAEGLALELGSGGGFAKQAIPELVTSDVVPYPEVDRVIDATAMPFPDGSVRFLAMLNTLHHIPDADRFFAEAQRCLCPGGRMVIVDQYRGWISEPILRARGDEPYEPDAPRWSFDSTGPLTSANGALAWIIFHRDRARFQEAFTQLRLVRILPHSPLIYWLTGGLKAWNLLPFPWMARLAAGMDRLVAKWLPRASSFVTYELVKA